MKSLLLWLVTVLALVAAALFYIANGSKTEELAKVRPQLQELESLRKENTDLKASQLSTEELERIRKNTEELVRLRNEVRQLRETEKQLTQQVQKTQAAAERAQAQAEAARTQAQTAQAQAQAQLQALASTTNAPQPLTHGQDLAARVWDAATGKPSPVGKEALACLNNLRQLEGAKQQWALENNKPENATPTAQDILPYLRNGLPTCPSGGVYTLSAMQAHPTCSTQGHALPRTFE
jgi:TolA-binding protein